MTYLGVILAGSHAHEMLDISTLLSSVNVSAFLRPSSEQVQNNETNVIDLAIFTPALLFIAFLCSSPCKPLQHTGPEECFKKAENVD